MNWAAVEPFIPGKVPLICFHAGAGAQNQILGLDAWWHECEPQLIAGCTGLDSIDGRNGSTFEANIQGTDIIGVLVFVNDTVCLESVARVNESAPWAWADGSPLIIPGTAGEVPTPAN